MGVLYIKWLGLTAEKFSAVNSDKLVPLGYTPQDMQWAETCQAIYLAAQNEMMCGYDCISQTYFLFLTDINCRCIRVKKFQEN